MATVPMFNPSGVVGMVPADKADAAAQSGYARAVKMTNPKGQDGWVREDKKDAALKSGFKVSGQAAASVKPTTTSTTSKPRVDTISARPKTLMEKAEPYLSAIGLSRSQRESTAATTRSMAKGSVQNFGPIAVPALATIGAIAGGPAGAFAGGYVGSGIEQKGRGETPKYSEAMKTASLQAGLEILGGPAFLKAIGKKSGPMADRMMARLLGVSSAKRTAAQVREIGNIVNNYVGGAATLNRLSTKIGATKEGFNALTEKLVQRTPGAKLVPWDSIVYDNGMKAIDQAEAFNRGTKSIDELVSTLEKKLPSNATPKEALEMRRSLLREKDPASGQALWPAGTKQFRTMLYHDLNRAIGRALPPKEAAEFTANNNRINKLIQAEEAIGRKLSKREAGQAGESVFGRVARSPIAWGAAAGAGEGAREEHSLGGAVKGAAVGALGVKAVESTAARSAAIKALRQGEHGVRVRDLPTAVRTAQAITSVQSRPQNQ